MSDAQMIEKIGETVWGAQWLPAMAAALSCRTSEIEAWTSGRQAVPLAVWKDLREAARQQALKLADLDAAIVASFDAAWQREGRRPR